MDLKDLTRRALGGDAEAVRELRRRGLLKEKAAAGRFAASHAQKSLWLWQERNPDSVAYSMPAFIPLSGATSVDACERAVSALLQRHESLRTVFEAWEGKLFQRVQPPNPVRPPSPVIQPAPASPLRSVGSPGPGPAVNLNPVVLAVEDLRSLPDPRAAMLEAVKRDLELPFDLGCGPLIRFVLFLIGGAHSEARRVLFVNAHHIILDGFSQVLLAGEIKSLCEAFAEVRSASLPPPVLQIKDHAAWQSRMLQSERGEAMLDWWRGQLSEVEPLDLPLDFPRPGTGTCTGKTLTFTLDREAEEALSRFTREAGCTSFNVLAFCTAALLARYAGTWEATIGMPCACRALKETQSLIGLLANPVALRFAVDPEKSFIENLVAARATLLETMERQDYPFELLLEKLDIPLHPGRNPLFDVVVASAHGTGQNRDDLLPDPTELSLRHSKFDLLITFEDSPEITNPTTGLRASLSPASGERVGVRGLSEPIFPHPNPLPEGEGTIASSGAVPKSRRSTKATIEYNAELFLPERVERMAAHLSRLLAGAAASPGTALGSIDILPEDERRKVTVDFNATRSPYPEKSLAQLFEETAARFPDRLAVAGRGEKPATYAEIDHRAEAVADSLRRALDVRPGSFIGIVPGSRSDMIVSILGILKARCGYMPIDPTQPPARIALLLDLARCPLVLAADNAGKEIILNGSPSIPVLTPGDLPEAPARKVKGSRRKVEAPRRKTEYASPDEPCYLMFTSGSTGEPKGVSVPHRGVVRLVLSTDYVRFTPEDRVLQSGPLAFDASTFQIWGPLLSGGCVCLAEKDSILEPGGLARLISEHGITVLLLTTGLCHRIAEDAPETFGPLRALLTGGDILSPRHARRILERCPDLALINGYGPTENTTFTTTHTVAIADTDGPIPIGRPIANTRVYILDSSGHPAPIGVWGEICAAGDGLAVEYLGRPDLTAKAFVEVDALPGERLYRTGDVGRWRDDGVIEFLGRRDTQVKVRGFRIEIEEIENTLLRAPGVRQAAVVVLDRDGDKELAVFVKADFGGPEQWRLFLEGNLPPYMVPAHFTAVAEIPLTSSGKADRRRLAAMAPDGAGTTVRSGPPRGGTERAVAAIFEEVLGRPVGRLDDFFHRGGHSLKAMQVLSRIEKRFKVPLALRAFFTSPTVEATARQIRNASDESWLEIPRTPEAPDYPVSHAQRRLWILSRMEGGSRAYNVTGALKLEGELDPEILGSVLHKLSERHEILRTTFELSDDEIRQKVHATLPPLIERIDLSREADPMSRALDLAQENGRHPFDLERGPLWRLMEIRTGRAEHVLLFAMHHIVSDGWSVDILVREMETLYAAMKSGRAPDRPTLPTLPVPPPLSPRSLLPPLPIQYRDYAVWRNEREAADDGGHMAYWLERLSHAPPPPDLPADRQRPRTQSFRGAALRFNLPEELAEVLKNLAGSGHGYFACLTALIKSLLHRYTGAEDILVGCPVAGREHGSLEDQVGLYVNTVVLRDTLHPGMPFIELAENVARTITDALDHQSGPFDLLVERLGVVRDVSRPPLFNVMVSFQNPDRTLPSFSGLRAEVLDIDSGTSHFDLTFDFQKMEDGLHVILEYNTDLFDASRMERLRDHFLTLAASAASAPGTPIGSLRLLPEAELAQVLAWGNELSEPIGRGEAGSLSEHASQTSFPRRRESRDAHISWIPAFAGMTKDGDPPVLEPPPGKGAEDPVARFEALADEDPEAPALVFNDVRLSRADVNRRANALARVLLDRGLRLGEPVALLLSRSERAAWAALGVAKAGGAFVYLDPEHPRARIEQILRQVEVRFAVVESLTKSRLAPVDNAVDSRVCGAGFPGCQFAEGRLESLPHNPPNHLKSTALEPVELQAEGPSAEIDSPAGDSPDRAWPEVELIDIDFDMPLPLDCPNPETERRPEDLAYIVFTSGSTGTPKGVLMERAALANLMIQADRYMYDGLGGCPRRMHLRSVSVIPAKAGIQETCRSLDSRLRGNDAPEPLSDKLPGPGLREAMSSAFIFDVAIQQIFASLSRGHELHVLPEDARHAPSRFLAYLDRVAVDVADTTPGFLAEVLEEIGSGGLPRSLKRLTVGNEALPWSVVERFFSSPARSGVSLVNVYGPTECCVNATAEFLRPHSTAPGLTAPIGRPLPGLRALILDKTGNPAPISVPGEIVLSGAGLARGYLNQPEIEGDRFAAHPFRPGERIYRTGDIGRFLEDGRIEFLGRLDEQLKVRGFRIEAGEIEHRLRQHPSVRSAAVGILPVRDDAPDLVAWVETGEGHARPSPRELREHLAEALPGYMIPAFLVPVELFPLLPGGKADKRALARDYPPGREAVEKAPGGSSGRSPAEDEAEALILDIWRSVLKSDAVGPDVSFFEAGGNSLLVIRVHREIDKLYPGALSVTDLFSLPTVADQARRIEAGKAAQADEAAEASPGSAARAAILPPSRPETSPLGTGKPTAATGSVTVATGPIAVIGMAVRLADYDDLDGLWTDLVHGVDRVRPFPEERRRDAEALLSALGWDAGDATYRDMAFLDRVDLFDPGFFRLSPADGSLLAPVHRIFVETAWRAAEDAGYGGRRLQGARVGVFAGGGGFDQEFVTAAQRALPQATEQVFAANTPSNLVTRLAYLMDWHGPAMLVDTACSSGLAAVHVACRSLLAGECDLALAGAAKVILLPLHRGGPLQVESADGRTRAFNDGSDGTGAGEGSIVILLKPLDRATADGDRILGVIRASAMNQDGASAGLTVPNAEAQAELIREAWRKAGLDPSAMGYLEAHGTGTSLGDPIEIDGVTKAVRTFSRRGQFIPVGSVKTNFGHLDNAAGVLGLAKALLSLEREAIPPSIHFETPNRAIRFEDSPLYVCDRLTPWPRSTEPRRCGVSSFGLSGINCHVVIEEPPAGGDGDYAGAIPDAPTSGPHLLPLAAPSDEGLARLARDYLYRLAMEPELRRRPADMCFTASVGRSHEGFRLAMVFDSVPELQDMLEAVVEKGPHHAPELGIRHGAAQRREAGRSNSAKVPVGRDVPAGAAPDGRSPVGQAPDGPDGPNGPNGHMDRAALDFIAEQYTLGLDIDWEPLCRGQNRRSVTLPASIMNRKRLWPAFDARVDRASASAEGGRTSSVAKVGQALSDTALERASAGTARSLPGPLLEHLLAETPERAIYGSSLAPDRCWPVGEHRVSGANVLVGTAYLQMAFEASARHGIELPLEVRDLFLERLLAPSSDTSVVIEVFRGEAPISLRVSSREKTGEWSMHAEAQLAPGGDPPPRIDLDGIRGRLSAEGEVPWPNRQTVRPEVSKGEQNRRQARPSILQGERAVENTVSPMIMSTPTEGLPSTGERATEDAEEQTLGSLNPAPDLGAGFLPHDGPVQAGERWNCLRRVWSGDGEMLGLFELPSAFMGDLDDYAFHPALLDAALHFALPLCKDSRNLMPMSMAGAKLYSPVPARIYSHARLLSEASAPSAHFDFTLCDDEGIVIVDIQGYTLGRYKERVRRPRLLVPRWVPAPSEAMESLEEQGTPLEHAGGNPSAVPVGTKRRAHPTQPSDREHCRVGTASPCPPEPLTDFRPNAPGGDPGRVALILAAGQQETPLAQSLIQSLSGTAGPFPSDTAGPSHDITGPIRSDTAGPVLVDAAGPILAGIITIESELTEARAENMARELAQMDADGIVFLPPAHRAEAAGDVAELEARLRMGIEACFLLVKALVNHAGATKRTLLLVGRGAFKVDAGEPKDRILTDGGVTRPENAALAALARTVRLEYDHIRCRYVDVDNHTGGSAVLSELRRASVEPPHPIALRGSTRMAEQPAYLEEDEAGQGFPFGEGDVVVVSGGLGGMGLALSRRMAEHAKLKLALLGRRTLPARETWETIMREMSQAGRADPALRHRIEGVRALEEAGSEVMPVAADVSDAGSLAQALGAVRRRWGRIRGVIHCAGEAGDGFLFRKDLSEFRRVIRPKIQGTWLLDEQTREDRPGFFFLCSSLTGITGGPGQGDYAAANGFQDAWAQGRADGGLRALSLAWCAWAETGMAFEHGVVDPARALTTAEALDVFDRALASFEPRLFVEEPGSGLRDSSEGAAPIQPPDSSHVPLHPAPSTRPSSIVTRRPSATLTGRPRGEPYSETEAAVAAIWAEVLGHETMDVTDDFFRLGGDSINALRIRNEAVRVFGLDVSIADLFAHPTIERYAALMESKRKDTGTGTGVEPRKHAITRAADRPAYPLSIPQRWMFRLWEDAPESRGWNLPEAWEIRGELDPQRMESALRALIRRHEILRARFRIGSGAPRVPRLPPDAALHAPLGTILQTFEPWEDFRLSVREVSPDEIEDRARRFVQPFDLLGERLFRAEMLRIAHDRHVLCLDMHHAAADALSLDILGRELGALYRGLDLPELPVRYRDYAVWQEERMESGEIEPHLAYWTERFRDGVPLLHLPTDFPRRPQRRGNGDIVRLAVPDHMMEGAKRLARENGATLFAVFLSAVFAMLGRLTDQEDMVVEISDHGRTVPEIQDAFGMFVGALPLRARVDGEASAALLVETVRFGIMEALEHREVPVYLLAERLRAEPPVGRSRLADVAVSYMNFGDSIEAGATEWDIRPLRANLRGSSVADLKFYVTERGRSMEVVIEYDSDLFRPGTAERFADLLLSIMGGMAADPATKVGKLGGTS